MNEIQAVKTAKIEEVKKNSKKGFTLVELVVVIAILAVLAAIAIPVVASTIKSSQISSAQSNAQTIETAIKEAKAAGDDSIFVNSTNGHKASKNDLTVADVLGAKKITSAAAQKYTIDGTDYNCVYDATDEKVYFAAADKKSTIGKDSNDISSHSVIALTTTAQDGKISVVTTDLKNLKVTQQAGD